jgi:hypothetical protein
LVADEDVLCCDESFGRAEPTIAFDGADADVPLSSGRAL